MKWWSISLALVAAFIFYLTTSAKYAHFDYTHRLAVSFLEGRLGIAEHPPWLNELIPLENGNYTGAYGLGAILIMVPCLSFSPHVLIALIAGACVFFFFLLGGVEANCSTTRRTMLALFPVFATWTWTDLGLGGAWQITEGFAMLGQVGALYFILVSPRPIIAGAFFALAFGNRTEIFLLLPVYLWLIKDENGYFRLTQPSIPARFAYFALRKQRWLCFLVVPAALALLTAAYNSARFQSPFDFGHARIPGAMSEPWCQHGLISLYDIPYNAYHMLLEGFYQKNVFPSFMDLTPSPWGLSIFLASPFLFLLFREGGKYKVAAWTAIGLLTAMFLVHCNQGGWQFSYRYAMALLPWMFIVILTTGKPDGRMSANEAALFTVSVAINAAANWLFLWTGRMGS